MSRQHVVTLTIDERQHLASLIQRRRTTAYVRRRARILLACDASQYGPRLRDREAAAQAGCDVRTVARVRATCAAKGMRATITRKPRHTNTPTRLDGEGEARLTALWCSPPPDGTARWTLKLAATQLVAEGVVPSICLETVRQTLKKTI